MKGNRFVWLALIAAVPFAIAAAGVLLLILSSCGPAETQVRQPEYRQVQFRECAHVGGDPAACYRRATMKSAGGMVPVVDPSRDNRLEDHPDWPLIDEEIRLILASGADRLADAVMLEEDPLLARDAWMAAMGWIEMALADQYVYWRCWAFPKECEL